MEHIEIFEKMKAAGIESYQAAGAWLENNFELDNEYEIEEIAQAYDKWIETAI